MANWYMLTLVGEDRPGIVAKVTAAIYEGGGNLGEASMMRLGGNFTIMLMVAIDGPVKALNELLEPVVDSLGLRCHIDTINGRLHQHQIPDVRVTVFGADRTGIVAQVTGALAEAGLNVLELDSDVAGTEAEPIYVMTIEGVAQEGIESLRSALEVVTRGGIEARVEAIETLIG